MSKKLTPLQEAIAWCDEQLASTQSDVYKPFIINVKAKLISILQKEKEFDEDEVKFFAKYRSFRDMDFWISGWEEMGGFGS